MDSGIVITVNLPGKIGPRVKHTTKQVYTADVTPLGGKPEHMTRKIKHTNRVNLPAARKINISGEVVQFWQNSDCPFWARPHVWKKLNKTQKLQAYVATFDEGYGATYE